METYQRGQYHPKKVQTDATYIITVSHEYRSGKVMALVHAAHNIQIKKLKYRDKSRQDSDSFRFIFSNLKKSQPENKYRLWSI